MNSSQRQINQRHDPCLDRQDEENHKLAVRVGGSKGQNKAQMQVVGHLPVYRQDVCQVGVFRLGDRAFWNDGAENHGKDVHQHHTGEIKKIKLQRAHGVFHMLTQHIEEVKENQFQKTASGLGEDIGDQSPDLTLEDFVFVKAEQFINDISTVYHGHKRHDGIAQDNVDH